MVNSETGDTSRIFKTKEELDRYTEQFSDRFMPGEIQFIDDTAWMWVGTENQWTPLKVEPSTSGISMSIYDLNEQIITQLPDHNEDDIKDDIEIINNFDNTLNTKYYMMLCKEASYYTVFVNETNDEFDNLGSAVIACAQDLGNIKSVEAIGTSEVEIWVLGDEMYCLHLFDYQHGIVAYGG